MATPPLPSTMRTWQYTSTTPSLAANLKLNPTAPLPTPKSSQHLVRVIAVALNPVDYKPASIPCLGRLIVPRRATPGIDFSGTIVTPAVGSSLAPGTLVFGAAGSSPVAGGALAEYTVAGKDSCMPVPEGVDAIDASTVSVAAMTAYQSAAARLKEGERVFINGGSGGCGMFGIQFAKALGCHVTTSCSTRNVPLCKELGADEVLDYTKGDMVKVLVKQGRVFDHAVDNVGGDKEVYWRAHEYLKPGRSIVVVGGEPSWDAIGDTIKRKLLPEGLGGVKGKIEGFWPSRSVDDLGQIAKWMQEGRVKPVLDQKFAYEDAPEAFERLKTGRARGKIVIDVASQAYKNGWN